MKKFQFKLQTLLEVRQRKEDLAQKELLAAKQELELIVQAKDKLQQESIGVEEDIRIKQKGSCHPQELASSFQYLTLVKQRLAIKEDEMFKVQNKVERQRQALAKAMQERKVIENLKEKQYAKWQQEGERAESAFLDEQATMRANRKE